MAKVVYGVSGEGSGHSSRAREIATHLLAQGHDLWLASYDRGYRNLKDDFRVLETEGLCIASDDNQVSVVKTLTENLRRLPEGHRCLQELRYKLFEQFQPDCVITDFEPMTAYLANYFELPLITIDNQHRMRYMDYSCPPGLVLESQVTKNIIRAMVPRPDVSLVITFFVGRPTNQRTFFFPPIVRREVFDKEPRSGNHVLVYLTSGFESFLQMLREFPRESFLVYGSGRQGQEGPVQYRPFSKDGFLDDLANAKAVMATAGFTLISEALVMGKPYLALPMVGQFEQQLNAFQLEQLGYGIGLETVTPKDIGNFLYHIPDYAEQLRSYESGDRYALTRKLDELLADQAALAKDFHRRRNELS